MEQPKSTIKSRMNDIHVGGLPIWLYLLALVLLAAALAMLGLGCCADKESRKGNKAHKAPADTVKPKSRRKAG